MDTDRGQIVLEGAGNRSLARVRQKNRLAVRSKQRPELGVGSDLGKAGEFPLQLLTVHFAQIGNVTLAEMGKVGLGEGLDFVASSHASLLIAGRPIGTNPR